jgi:predicted AlkP superfamily phosphohydrolase/phosphomutase
MGRRVVVLGLDGVPDWLLRQLAAEGVMPHTARLLTQGDLRAMDTVHPPLSSVSWTTFATGVNPGRHRIFGFFEFQTDGHRLWYQDAQDVKMPSLWDYAQAHGRRTVSINLPGTYPARPLNGVMISGFMARELASSVYPRLLLPHLEKIGYRLDVDCDAPAANAERFFADAHAALAARAHTMAAFLEHEPWDLFIGVFTETDRVQHYFFDALLEPHHPEHERVRRFYRAVDEALGRCLAKVRDEDELILLADHGFCRIEQEVFLNTWLAEHGYLTPAEPGASF